MGHSSKSKIRRALAVPAVGLTLGLGGVALASSPASAACAPYGPSSCSTPQTGGSSEPHEGLTTSTASASSSSLAFTGTDAAVTAAVGAGAVAAGGMVVLATRRRRASS